MKYINNKMKIITMKKRHGRIALAASLLVTMSSILSKAATIMGVEYPDIEIFDEKRTAG